MKIFIITVIFCIGLTCTCAQDTSVGNRDITPLLQNNALVQQQINCVLDRGPCDNNGRMLKLAIPEVLGRNCRSCNPQQAANARRLTNFVRQNYPDVYRTVVARYSG